MSVVSKIERHAVDEGAEFAGVDEEGLFAAVAEAAFCTCIFAFREEPEADGKGSNVDDGLMVL